MGCPYFFLFIIPSLVWEINSDWREACVCALCPGPDSKEENKQDFYVSPHSQLKFDRGHDHGARTASRAMSTHPGWCTGMTSRALQVLICVVFSGRGASCVLHLSDSVPAAAAPCRPLAMLFSHLSGRKQAHITMVHRPSHDSWQQPGYLMAPPSSAEAESSAMRCRAFEMLVSILRRIFITLGVLTLYETMG